MDSQGTKARPVRGLQNGLRSPPPQHAVKPPDPPERLLHASFVLGRRVGRVGPDRQLRGLERLRSVIAREVLHPRPRFFSWGEYQLHVDDQMTVAEPVPLSSRCDAEQGQPRRSDQRIFLPPADPAPTVGVRVADRRAFAKSCRSSTPEGRVSFEYWIPTIAEVVGYQSPSEGLMFWFMRKKLSGSYFALIRARRSYFSGP
jgi:hypothetical protein